MEDSSHITSVIPEAQLPLREHGVGFVLSSHHNTGIWLFCGFYAVEVTVTDSLKADLDSPRKKN